MGPTKEFLVLHRSKLALLIAIYSEFSVSFLFLKPPTLFLQDSGPPIIPTLHFLFPFIFPLQLSSLFFCNQLNLIAYNLLNTIEFHMWFLFANDILLVSKTLSVCPSPSKSPIPMVTGLNRGWRALSIIQADFSHGGNTVTGPSLISHHQGINLLFALITEIVSFSKGTWTKVTY